MDFCSVFTIARVIMGSVKKGEKYEGLLLLEVFFRGGNLTELCLYILGFLFSPQFPFSLIYFPLTFLWYDILVEKGSMHRNGMAAIPKTFCLLTFNVSICSVQAYAVQTLALPLSLFASTKVGNRQQISGRLVSILQNIIQPTGVKKGNT